MSQFAVQAIRLLSQGITCIPYIGKRPHVTGWPQIRNLTQEQIIEWDHAELWQNIGILTGEASGNIVVVDFDGIAGYEMFKEKFPELVNTKTVASGSGLGMHVYFKCDLLPDGFEVLRAIIDGGELINVEFKANGGAVVIPPSIHPKTGKPYTVAIDLPMLQVSDLSRLAAWAKGLKPDFEKDWQKPKTIPTTPSGDLNPKLLEAIENYFLSQPHKMNDEWINCSCPDSSKHKHGDENFSFGYSPAIGYGKCFGCGDMNLKKLLPLIGMDARSYGGIYLRKEQEEPAPLDRIPTAQAQPPIPPAASPAPIATSVIPVVKRSSRIDYYLKRVHDRDTPVESPPVVFPLRALHQLGGMAQIIKPGKAVGVVGLSGGGKTSLLETMVDGFLDDNTGCLVWSPEWTPDEFLERSTQRYSGPTATQLYLHEKFIADQQRGIKSKYGKELTPEQIQSADNAAMMLQRWDSEVGYLDSPFLTIGELKTKFASTLASLDFKPGVLVVDYLQLFHALEPNINVTLYSMIMQIKSLCGMFKMIPVLSSQVTKADTKGKVRKDELLDASSARYVNDDAFNLFITINPEYDSFGNKYDWAVLNVAKNSMGRPGKVRVGVDWAHLSFDQEPHAYQGKLEPEDENEEDKDE